MPRDPSGTVDRDVPVVLVPEVRDFLRINAEVVGLLNQGHPRVRLDGAGGQRLLLAGLTGPWRATVEVHGPTGPELAANLDAPGLAIVARGPTQDGAGRGLRAGSVLICGDCGDGAGAAQAGGVIVVAGTAGHRAGLNQAGGVLAVLGGTGRLAGDRQAGGTFFLGAAGAGAFAGRGRSGGRLIRWDEPIDAATEPAWREVVRTAEAWLEPGRLLRPGMGGPLSPARTEA